MQIEYRYSDYLEKLLTKTERKAVITYIIENVNMGYSEINSHFTISNSDGLEQFKRIDVYINGLGLIFLSSLVK